MIKVHARSRADFIIKRETERLNKAANYLNFAGLSFVTAWHRYIEHFGLERYHYEDDDAGTFYRIRFIGAYKSANSQHAENADVSDDNDGYFRAMDVILSISDWLQYYDRGTIYTPLASNL